MKDEKKTGVHVWFFSHFRQDISKSSEIMADNSQRFLVICNQVNLMICLVITNQDFYGLPIMVDKFSDDFL